MKISVVGSIAIDESYEIDLDELGLTEEEVLKMDEYDLLQLITDNLVEDIPDNLDTSCLTVTTEEDLVGGNAAGKDSVSLESSAYEVHCQLSGEIHLNEKISFEKAESLLEEIYFDTDTEDFVLEEELFELDKETIEISEDNVLTFVFDSYFTINAEDEDEAETSVEEILDDLGWETTINCSYEDFSNYQIVSVEG